MRYTTILLLMSACTHHANIGSDIDAAPVDAASSDAVALTCASRCSPPNATTLCVQGSVYDFLDPSRPISPAEAAQLRVRIYDPIALETDPGMQPFATVTIDDDGCFVADGIYRPSIGMIAWTVDDAGPDDRYMMLAVMAVAQSDRNVLGVKGYALLRSTVADWQTQIGNVSGQGCSTLESCGLWIGEYVDQVGNPVAGVTPTRIGDMPPPEAIFCFRGDRLHLSTEDATDATGLCAISPDYVENHGGTCTGCNLTWPMLTNGAAPTMAVLQRFVAQ